VRDSFIAAGVPGTKIVVVPGAGPAVELPDLEGMVCRRTDPGRPALFVAAGHLSIRKGTHYLLEAWRKIGPRPDAQLLLVGHDSLPPALKEGLPDNVTIRANVPREELFGIFREATSLVLPSLCEGFAMVILEALAHALPVITTPNSGGADFVRNGEAGWIVPIRDPESLADRIVWSIEHRDQMAQMGMTGRIRSQYWTWDDFASVHAGIIREFMETQTVSASAWAEPWNDVPSINA
jgi:glycosyltransferase involved in cell wall biosynthesis